MTAPVNPPPEEPADRVEHYDVDRYPGGERQTVVVEDRAAAQTNEAARLSGIVGVLFGILEALLVIRVVLRLLGANPGSPFANFIYGVTQPFLAPFQGLFGEPAVGNMVLEPSTLVAIVIYGLIGYILSRLIWLAMYRPASRHVRTIDRDDYR